MGGSAFPDLYTPRMPTQVYVQVRDDVLKILCTFFDKVECTIEGPGKVDHGDIDLHVTSPHESDATSFGRLYEKSRSDSGNILEIDPTTIATALHSIKHLHLRNSPTTNFAIPWPESLLYLAPPQPNDTSKPLAIQLDIHVSPTLSLHSWTTFHHSHGDAWNILGSMIRPHGLTAGEAGLYLRIEQLEIGGMHGKEACRVFLTADPKETLEFLGLDEDKYWAPFESVEEMFKFLQSCRFFDPAQGQEKARGGDAAPSSAGNNESKSDWSKKQRVKLRKRDIFRKWVDEFLPRCRETGVTAAASAGMTRDEMVEQALGVFVHARDEYYRRLTDGIKEIRERNFWKTVRQSVSEVAEGLRLGVVMRGIKREVVTQAEGKDVRDMNAMQKAFVEGRAEEVEEWVKRDWEDIEERQMKYEKEASRVHFLKKLEKDGLKNGAEAAERDGDKAKEKVDQPPAEGPETKSLEISLGAVSI